MKEGSHNNTQKVRVFHNGPPYSSLILLHHYQNASIQGRQIQCMKDQIEVSHVDKNMVEQSALFLLVNL